jgi:hypothetical protein
MKPQTQRWRRAAVFANGEQTDDGGDCFSACVASILEIDIEGFPNFLANHGEKTWFDRWQDYLYENFRQKLIWFDGSYPDYNLIAWWIAEVMVGEVPHSVIFHKDEFRWDPIPNPFKKVYELSDVKSVTLIYSIGSIFEESND